MFRLVVVLACIAAAIAATLSLDERIIGGKEADLGQFPYQVSIRLRHNGQHHCGGTIINTRFIITAAHCIETRTVKHLFVVVGSISITSGGTDYNLEHLIAHPEFDKQTTKNDIGILKTSEVIEFSSTVKAIPLQEDEIPTGSNFIVSGWGMTSWVEKTTPDILQYINPRSIDNDQCARAVRPMNIFDSHMCTLLEDGQRVCLGDSGGPLVCDGRLAGVVSWSRPCVVGYPDVFAKVSSYISWIQLTIQSM